MLIYKYVFRSRAPNLLTVSYDTRRERELRSRVTEKRTEMQSKDVEQRERQQRYRELEKQQAQLREQRVGVLCFYDFDGKYFYQIRK